MNEMYDLISSGVGLAGLGEVQGRRFYVAVISLYHGYTWLLLGLPRAAEG